MGKHVVILGGGVAGMSAAHELINRGYEVDVFESRPVPGGKARSMSVPATGKDGRKDLPGEHGFRFFPRFYRNLPATMKEIPSGTGSGTTFDNLVYASRELVARVGQPNLEAVARLPKTLADWKALVTEVFAPTGLTEKEKHFAAERLWQLATSCQARFANEYESLSWWNFVQADRFSDSYRSLFAIGFTRTLVAARARTASTRVGGSILMQLIYGMMEPEGTDRLLNGPTDDAWITPWYRYLESRGVRFHFNAPASHIDCDGGRVSGVRIDAGTGAQTATADYYLCAVPVEVMARLLDPALIAADPTLQRIQILGKDVAWMNGMQLYLNHPVEIVDGHAMFVDSPWALTALSQLQFWPGFDISQYGDGEVRGIISIDISNWDDPGILRHGPDGTRKSAKECTREEIKDEVWAQLKASLNKPGEEPVLRDEYLHAWYLDADIEPVEIHRGATLWRDAEPLLVNKINTWHLRPETHTGIPNLFLASDYVKTAVSLATMEGANEAARRAVNDIIGVSGGGARYCKVFPLKQPWLLAPFRWNDARRCEKGLPWNGRLFG